MMPLQSKDRVLEQIIAVLRRFPQIEKAVLFGSRARGDYRPQSDYDIAIYPKCSFTELTANEIFDHIRMEYMVLFNALARYFRNENTEV